MTHTERNTQEHEKFVPTESISNNAPEREWVEPTFERIGLKEAMSGGYPASDSFDLYYGGS